MARSMTAYASCEAEGNWGSARWEIRSTNHRYLEPSFKLPESLKMLEFPCREEIKKILGRGKVECSLYFDPPTQENIQFRLNTGLIGSLINAGEEIARKIEKPASTLSPWDILRWPGVLNIQNEDVKNIEAPVMALFDNTLKELMLARVREGHQLKALILEFLVKMQHSVQFIVERLPVVTKEYREKLIERLTQIQQSYDQNRLEQEMVYVLQRMDVSEEIGRLQAHMSEVRNIIESDGVMGRRLDFLLQELNREANTLSSKSLDNPITKAAVEIKVLIEMIREQVQNLE